MKRIWKVLGLAALLTASVSMTAMAGQWNQDDTGWWWQEDDGTYPTSSWQWLDGNGDGVYESYYFDANGYLAVNTAVDGYQVDGNGCWVDSGRVMTRQTGDAARSLLQASLGKSEAQNDMDTDLIMNMDMAAEGMSINVGMTGNMKIKNADSADMEYLMNLNMNLLGQQMNLTSFYADGYTYMDMYGQKMKVPTDYAAALEASQTAELVNADDMAYIQDVSAVDNAGGTRTIYYTMDGAKLNELVQQMTSAMTTTVSAADLSLGTCKGELTQDGAGNIIQQRMLMDMDLAVEGSQVSYEVFMEMNIKNPGQSVDFALPSTDGYVEVTAAQ